MGIVKGNNRIHYKFNAYRQAFTLLNICYYIYISSDKFVFINNVLNASIALRIHVL